MHTTYLLPDLRKAASVILAASAKKTFPDTQLVGGGVTPLAFYYDFIFPFAFQSSLLVLIEEEMMRLVKRGVAFSYKEMIPMCAADFLKHKGHVIRSEKAASCDDSLVSLIEFEGFVDLIADALVCPSASSIGALKLKVFEKIGKKEGYDVIRIWGAADRDKASLKQFLKSEGELVQKAHTTCGFQKNYFKSLDDSCALWLWLPKGVALLNDLKNLVNKELALEGYLPISLPAPCELAWHEGEDGSLEGLEALGTRAELAARSGLSKVSEEVVFTDFELDDFSCGLLKTHKSLFDVQYTFSTDAQLKAQCISSLQFIIKMLKILGFEFKIIFSARKGKSSSHQNREKAIAFAVRDALNTLGVIAEEKTHSTFQGVQLDFLVADALGREWKVSLMRVLYLDSNRPVVISSLLGGRERALALLIEMGKELSFQE